VEKPVFINPVKRMVRQKGALSALLVTGSDKVESGFGNGDCLLMDFSRLLFAVSDGSERHPNASRLLLERLADVLPAPHLSFDIDALQDAIRRIYAAQKYTHKCTFSCVALVKNKRDFTAYISSGGDSMVIVADSSDGSIIFKTVPDMNFAGRSKNVPGISTLTLKDRNLRVIVATDGFAEVLNKIEPKHERLPGWIFTGSVCNVANKFRRRFKRNRIINYDDIGMIIVDPFAVCFDDKVILAGGTLPAKEALFVSSFASRTGKWVEKERWPGNAELFDSAGIKIKDEKNK